MRRRLPIKYLVPLLMTIVVTLSVCTTYVVNYFFSRQHITSDISQKVSQRLSYLQKITVLLLASNNTDTLQSIIVHDATDRDFLDLYITNKNGVVIVADRTSSIGRDWRDTFQPPDRAQIQRLATTGQTIVAVDQSSNSVYGIAAACPRAIASATGNSDCGFIYYRLAIEPRLAAARLSVVHDTLYSSMGLFIAAFSLVIILHRVVSKPAKHIVNTLKDFSRGNHAIRAGLQHNDELSLVGKRLDEVLDEIVSTETQLRISELRLRATLDSVMDCIITINHRGIVMTVNPATEKLFGYTREEIIGKNISMLAPEPDRSAHDQYIANYLQTGERKVIGKGREIEGLCKDGSRFPAELTVTEIIVADEHLFLGLIRNISDRKKLELAMAEINKQFFQANLDLKKNSRTDALTGLFNRGHFDINIREEINRATRQGLALSLLLCDVDHFKFYNDHYGHHEGDLCLKAVADAMKNVFLRSGELPARYGGEEFAIILPGCTLTQAIERANALRKALHELKRPHAASPVASFVTISIGVGTYLPTSTTPPTPAQLINTSDEALYVAKREGRDQVQAREVS